MILAFYDICHVAFSKQNMLVLVWFLQRAMSSYSLHPVDMSVVQGQDKHSYMYSLLITQHLLHLPTQNTFFDVSHSLRCQIYLLSLTSQSWGTCRSLWVSKIRPAYRLSPGQDNVNCFQMSVCPLLYPKYSFPVNKRMFGPSGIPGLLRSSTQVTKHFSMFNSDVGATVSQFSVYPWNRNYQLFDLR